MFYEKLKKIEDKEKYSYILKYLDSSACIHNIDNIQVFKDLINFLSSHFEIINKSSEELTIGDIYFCRYDDFVTHIKPLINVEGEEVEIRRSSALRFNLDAKKYKVDNKEIFDYIDVDTSIIFSKEDKKVYIFASEKSDIVLVEFLRDLFIKDQERLGSIILHASAVVKGDSAFVVTGKKGAGKSTVLYNLILKYGYKMMSGDKVILKVSDGRIIAKGWPDYPHIGVGTIRNNEVLKKLLSDIKIEEMSNEDKILIDPIKFYSYEELKNDSRTLPLKCALFPRFSPDESFEIIECQNIEDELINNLEFKCDFSIAKWNDFIEVSEDKLEKIEFLKNYLSSYKGYILKGQINEYDKETIEF